MASTTSEMQFSKQKGALDKKPQGKIHLEFGTSNIVPILKRILSLPPVISKKALTGL